MEIFTYDSYNDINVICNCSRQTKAIYYCDVEECKDHEQLFFCNDCLAEEKHVHGKTKLKIKDEFNKRKQEWERLKMKFKDL